MGSAGTEEAQTVDVLRAGSPQPWLHLPSLVWGCPHWALSPHGQDEHGQPSWKGSSVVWIHASNAGCFWGTEVPECCFRVTCEVLCGTIKMLTGSHSGPRTEPLEGH